MHMEHENGTGSAKGRGNVPPGDSSFPIPHSAFRIPHSNDPFVVGLIGGIGSGKSAVADEFARHGARVILADQLGHEALRQPAIRAEIVRRWGKELLDEQGEINRRQLAAIVFQDEKALRALEALTHPAIRAGIKAEIARAGKEQVRLVVVDAAVLLEAGWFDVCDRVVYVDAPLEVRRARVTAKRGWTEQDWRQRESTQLPLTEKVARADHVLDNSSTLEHLSRQVDDLLHRWGLVPALVRAPEVSPSPS